MPTHLQVLTCGGHEGLGVVCRVDAALLPPAHAVGDARGPAPQLADEESVLAAVVRLVGVRDVLHPKLQAQLKGGGEVAGGGASRR